MDWDRWHLHICFLLFPIHISISRSVIYYIFLVCIFKYWSKDKVFASEEVSIFGIALIIVLYNCIFLS